MRWVARPTENETRTPILLKESTEPLPPYSYVPGGPWPHPIRSPEGHSYGRRESPIAPSGAEWSARFRRGIELFDAGYYWEAHEVWEGLWHAEGRRGAAADLLKGLIKLAAAGVKVRERQEHGVRIHASRAAECFAAARDQGGVPRSGLDLDLWIERSRAIAQDPPTDPGRRDAVVTRVFAFRISPEP